MHVFETWTATGSELFSLLTCLHTTTLTLPNIFSLLEMIIIKINLRDTMHCPGTQNVLFRLRSASQKCMCLSSLLYISMITTDRFLAALVLYT